MRTLRAWRAGRSCEKRGSHSRSWRSVIERENHRRKNGVRQWGEYLRCIRLLLLLLTDSRALARKAMNIQPNGAQLSQQHEQLKDAACLLRAGQVQYGGKQTVSLLVIYSATGLRVRPFFYFAKQRTPRRRVLQQDWMVKADIHIYTYMRKTKAGGFPFFLFL